MTSAAWGGSPLPTASINPPLIATHPPSISRRSASSVATLRALWMTRSLRSPVTSVRSLTRSRQRLHDVGEVVDGGERVHHAVAQDGLAVPGARHHERPLLGELAFAPLRVLLRRPAASPEHDDRELGLDQQLAV